MRSMGDAADIASGGILYAGNLPAETRPGLRPEQRLCLGELPYRGAAQPSVMRGGSDRVETEALLSLSLCMGDAQLLLEYSVPVCVRQH